MTGFETTAKGQRNPRTDEEDWPAGDYVLLVDRYLPPETWREHGKGARLSLDAETATRLGREGAIAPPGSEEAEKARDGC